MHRNLIINSYKLSISRNSNKQVTWLGREGRGVGIVPGTGLAVVPGVGAPADGGGPMEGNCC